MTVIRPNSISGITSITAKEGALNFYDSVGSNLPVTAGAITVDNINAAGVSTFSTLNVTNGTVISGVTTVSAGSTSAPSITPSGNSNTGIFFPSSDTIAFTEGGTESARIDSSGRLLVGTSTASGDGLLQVRNDSGGVCYDGFRAVSTTTGAPVFRLNKSRGTAASPTEVNSGDVLGYLAFAGYDGAAFADAAYITAIADGTWTDGGDTTDNPGALVFSTTTDGASSPTERMRIDSTGTILAGATSAINEAHTFIRNVNNNAFVIVNSATSGTIFGLQIRYSGSDPNSTSSSYLECYNAASSTLRAEIRSNGGLANYSANNANLSDRNAKKDITPATDTWDCIKEWEIVNYRYKDQPDDADLNLGVIAQQVAESCPEVITVFEEAKGDQPEKLGIKEQQMYWMAIKALQEAQIRIETLEAEVAALKTQ